MSIDLFKSLAHLPTQPPQITIHYPIGCWKSRLFIIMSIASCFRKKINSACFQYLSCCKKFDVLHIDCNFHLPSNYTMELEVSSNKLASPKHFPIFTIHALTHCTFPKKLHQGPNVLRNLHSCHSSFLNLEFPLCL